MTPLARSIVKQLTLPIKQREINDTVGLLRKMDDVHCFDVTEVVPLAISLQNQILKGGVDERSTFLPAPKTWIEWGQNSSEFGAKNGYCREGLLLVESEDKKFAKVYCAEMRPGLPLLANLWGEGVSRIELRYEPPSAESEAQRVANDEQYKIEAGWSDESWDKWVKFKAGRTEEFIFACLAMINTPRLIGRRTHVPSKTLERKILAKNPNVGKYPLLAWSEIKLQVGPPKDVSGSPSQEGHLTGRRALHFCRAFVRVRLGKLEIVRSHWRGDAALGMRQSRYKLTQAEQIH